ncbi:hypothetical protein [Secundilactobacillus malefermentans]|uniref:hypothetical protein n=1 Tax=Secundilactobacillus malefermentans TaxID=176292 RepID=UPI0011C79231|nr:hypothetical protein [Secundilactobacillus malefermentans]QEA32122.1 hypothetical protein FGL90_07965 [Secundilactobacillus malefermentans]
MNERKEQQFDNPRLQQIYDLLPLGMNQPITANELVKVTGYEKRDVYQLINELIMKHDIPVAGVRSGQAGYFIITSEEERERALMPLMSHTMNMERHINKLKTIKLVVK